MPDLPIAGAPVEEKVEKKEVPLTLEERVARLEKDILEVARGVNVQATLLESFIANFNNILIRYSQLTAVPPKPEEINNAGK